LKKNAKKLLIYPILCFFLVSISSLSTANSIKDNFMNLPLVDIRVDLDFNYNKEIPIENFASFESTNTALIFQIGSLNEAYQTQLGLENLAFVLQEGSNNYVFQYQEGNRNQAYVIQNGANNYASQYQYHDYNTGIIVQIGYNNEAFQFQSGGSTSIIIQQGNGWRTTSGFEY